MSIITIGYILALLAILLLQISSNEKYAESKPKPEKANILDILYYP